MNANLPTLDFLAPPQSADELGRLGTYRVLKLLGQGGMGMVFLAEDPTLQRTVALKVMLPEVATRATARERFLREARHTAKIEHDHIVTIYQVGEDRGVPFLAMQLLKGMSLEDYLRKKVGAKTGLLMSLGQVLKLAREIAKGLAAAHEHGLIHRDIKPANIWLDATAGGRVKILDFGLVRAAEEGSKLTRIGAIVGTPAYMAPEQARGDKLDGRADLFSLGCILYRLCTGRTPFKGDDLKGTLVAVASENPTPVQELNPELPQGLADLVMRLLAKKPEDRPASAKAVVEAVLAVERETSSEVSVTRSPAPLPAAIPVTWEAPTEATEGFVRQPTRKRRSRGGAFLLVGALAGLAVLAVVAVLALAPSDKGALTMETTDDDVQVVVEKNGNRVAVLDKQHAHVTLPVGEYQLRLAEEHKDVKLDKNRVQLTRDGATFAVGKASVAVLRPKDPTDRGPKATRPVDPPTTRKPPPEERPAETVKYLVNSIGMKLAPIPAGEFLMGCSAEEFERFQKEPHGYGLPDKTELPQHKVRITKPFYLGAHTVTQGQYQKVMGGNPVANKESPEHPVDTVNWFDGVEFCKKLSELPDERKAGRVYRLPTEAEWEYASRAGTTTTTSFGNTLSSRQANFDGAQPLGFAEKGPKIGKTVKVGSYPANSWGLHDMHGNLWQWCLDGARPYTADAMEDPRGPETPTADRLLKGGCWRDGAVPVAFRKARDPLKYRINIVGFRVLLVGSGLD